jgi:hypothetical protein
MTIFGPAVLTVTVTAPHWTTRFTSGLQDL